MPCRLLKRNLVKIATGTKRDFSHTPRVKCPGLTSWHKVRLQAKQACPVTSIIATLRAVPDTHQYLCQHHHPAGFFPSMPPPCQTVQPPATLAPAQHHCAMPPPQILPPIFKKSKMSFISPTGFKGESLSGGSTKTKLRALHSAYPSHFSSRSSESTSALFSWILACAGAGPTKPCLSSS